MALRLDRSNKIKLYTSVLRDMRNYNFEHFYSDTEGNYIIIYYIIIQLTPHWLFSDQLHQVLRLLCYLLNLDYLSLQQL
jgi:hypothetical protein